MSLYGAVGPVDVGEVKVASHPEYRVFCLDVRSSMVLHMSSIYIVGHYLEVGILRLL